MKKMICKMTAGLLAMLLVVSASMGTLCVRAEEIGKGAILNDDSSDTGGEQGGSDKSETPEPGTGEGAGSGEIQAGPSTLLYFDDLGKYGELSREWYSYSSSSFYLYAYLVYEPAGDEEVLTASTSDPEVATVEEIGGSTYYRYVKVLCKKVGAVTLTVSCGDATVSAPLIIYPDEQPWDISASLYSFEKVKVSWETIDERVSGYLIQQKAEGDDAYTTVKKVEGGSKTSGIVSAATGKAYTYRVIHYFEVDGKVIPTPDDEYFGTVEFTAGLPTTSLTSVKRSGSYLVLNWEAVSGTTGYKIYRSRYENDGYTLLKTVGEVTTYKNKATAGITWYYKIRPVFSGKTGPYSNSYGQMIPKKGTAKAVTSKKMVQDYRGGRYVWNWASPDETYFYTVGSKLYAAVYREDKNTLKVYGLNKKLAEKKTKSVKLPKLSIWGGVYHGADGYNYVAMGADNPKESDTKTVIKVVKYDKNWKAVKSAVIKGSASNSFKGIYQPFAAGNVSFALEGKTLYMFTCRTMYVHSDGLHHQSNIAFAINTKTMKAQTSNISYCSHSFDQQARFKDGSLYLLDHGDAYPRAILLTWSDGYGTDDFSVQEKEVFRLQGSTGANATGCEVGGMEIGAKNILTCGTAQPHYKKVNGVIGYGDLRSNLYVTVTNRKTGKTSVKWLTTYNPKTTKVYVEGSRMVKLSDDRFGILVEINDKLHYYLIDGTGKKLKHKKYNNIPFTGGTQPIVANGMIVWSETVTNTKTYATETKICQIPTML